MPDVFRHSPQLMEEIDAQVGNIEWIDLLENTGIVPSGYGTPSQHVPVPQ